MQWQCGSQFRGNNANEPFDDPETCELGEVKAYWKGVRWMVRRAPKPLRPVVVVGMFFGLIIAVLLVVPMLPLGIGLAIYAYVNMRRRKMERMLKQRELQREVDLRRGTGDGTFRV